MSGMWFLLGVVCGVAVSVWLCRGRQTADAEKADRAVGTPQKAWGETRNFLYYDGTMMPEIKEDLNEQ